MRDAKVANHWTAAASSAPHSQLAVRSGGEVLRKGGRGWVEAVGAASHRAEDANSAFNQRLGEDEKHPLAQTMVASGCVTMNPLLPES
jgi:hypothetical protein